MNLNNCVNDGWNKMHNYVCKLSYSTVLVCDNKKHLLLPDCESVKRNKGLKLLCWVQKKCSISLIHHRRV